MSEEELRQAAIRLSELADLLIANRGQLVFEEWQELEALKDKVRTLGNPEEENA